MAINCIPIYKAQHQAHLDFNEKLKLPDSLETACCTVNSNSILRNGAAFGAEVSKPFARVVAAAAPAVAISLVAHGIIGAPCAAALIRNNYLKGKQALACGDAEGVVNSVAMGSVGAAYLSACGLLTYQGVQLLSGAAIAAGAAVATAGLGVGMYGALGLISAYNLKQTRDFGFDLAQRKNSPVTALEWLRDQITVTSKETAGLNDDEIAQLLQKKWNQFELRAGLDPETSKIIREEVPDLCRDLSPKFEFNKGKYNRAVEIIKMVEKANFKAQVKHILHLLIALVGLASMITAIIFSGGLLVPLLMTIAAALWMTVDHSGTKDFIGDKLYELFHKDEMDALPLPLKA